MNKKENYGFKLTNSSLLASEYYSKIKKKREIGYKKASEI